MPRKTATVVIEHGRDAGKVFHIEEMPALQAERWALDAGRAVCLGDPSAPPDLLEGGWFGLLTVGLKALLRAPADLRDALFAELLACVRYQPDPANPAVVRPVGLGGSDDVEEPSTYARLRLEVFALHAGFSTAGFLSKLSSMKSALLSSNTGTSPAPSAPSSRQARRRSRS